MFYQSKYEGYSALTDTIEIIPVLVNAVNCVFVATNLPNNLIIDADNGTISGIADTAFNDRVTVTVTGERVLNRSFSLIINSKIYRLN